MLRVVTVLRAVAGILGLPAVLECDKMQHLAVK